MKRIAFTAATLIFCILAGAAASPQDSIPKKTYKATFNASPPVIDGAIEEDAWHTCEWQGDFTQFEPLNGALPSQKTEFAVLFDDNNIYVAIKARDTNPDSIVR
ncbi:hypothetical protein EG830_10260, partial [bacterium]|nr:hypothetical protein [bacterium]